MKKFNLYIITFIITFSLISSCQKNENILREGDIVFQDLDCGPVCDAIESVTEGYKNYNISHCGIVVKEGSKLFVIEAYGDVKKTPLNLFLNRVSDENGKPKVIVGRLKPEFRKFIPRAIIKAATLIGKPYDRVFELNNGKYYCSELIYEIFVDDNNQHLFSLKPMTYINPKTPKTDSVWKKYFKDLDHIIPEGELGCNPADYSRSDLLEIVYEYGKLSKK